MKQNKKGITLMFVITAIAALLLAVVLILCLKTVAPGNTTAAKPPSPKGETKENQGMALPDDTTNASADGKVKDSTVPVDGVHQPPQEETPLTNNIPVPEDDANPETFRIKRSLGFWCWENGKRVATNRTITAKAIRMDSASAEAREYIRIARDITATPSITIPDDVVPTVDMHGEWAIVTFPYANDMDENFKWSLIWADYYAEVIIEAKTKAVLAITLNKNLENKGFRSAEDFAPLVAESKAAPTTWHSFRNDDEGVKGIHSYVAFKKICLDPSAEKVAEYVRIADTVVKRIKVLEIPDDVVPITTVQGDNIVVSFPWRPPTDMPKELWHYVNGPDIFAEVVLDIKTKAVLGVIGGDGGRITP
ncbi:MAG: hypothetical protein FWH21_00670 [Kiritimatiellaeota bacterium]|nr:hypothetical protein [Kiritimatiellota bacterium]